MHTRHFAAALALCAMLLLPSGSFSGSVLQAQGTNSARVQTDGSPAQRLEIMRSRLEALRRSLSGSLATMNARDNGKAEAKSEVSADDPRQLLRGLDQEANSILSEVSDLRGKQDRAERYDSSRIDKLESSVADLSGRIDSALRASAANGSNSGGGVAQASDKSAATKDNAKKKKGGGGFLGIGRVFGRGGGDKYAELTGAAAVGRDRDLFESAAKEARKGGGEEGRYLFNTIITTYPDSPYLPAAKLAIADTFYLEGSTSSLIQAAGAYQDWLTFFPTHPLADDVMLKIAECEMRQMGLANRDVQHAKKAEQRLKVLTQQFPDTALKPEVSQRLSEVQELLALHNLQIARFYVGRSEHGNGGLKGAQSRLNEIVEKYPNFSYMDEVLFRQGALYLQEEEPDEAAKYFQRIARDYPNSEYAEKAREQLNAIGAPVPEPDPIKAKIQPAPRPSFTGKVFSEVLGTTQATVNKNGVLISKDDKADDLLAEAVRNGGQLPSSTPTAPVQRRAPARNVVPINPTTTRGNPTAVQNANGVPAAKPSGSGISIVPTPSGAPPDGGINPASAPAGVQPSSTQPAGTTLPSAPASTPKPTKP